VAVTLVAAHRRSVRALILYGTSPRRPPGTVMRQLRLMARQWGQGDSLGMFAPTLADELAHHDRAVFERASASPAMTRALVESRPGAVAGRRATAGSGGRTGYRPDSAAPDGS